MEQNIELLAPAGSAESLRAAVNAGADAVYMGSSRFGARAYADNPSEEDFFRAMDYAHLHGCRVYMTVNTLIKEKETRELAGYLRPFYERGIDAVILQDYGALLLIREWFPDLKIHASTQMTVTSRYFAQELKNRGVSRIIPARELSLTEIRAIHEAVDMEIECFVHGALCYCYSGQCLMSSLIGGRSGNRGRCAQPCRLPYETAGTSDRYLLSLKDLNTLDILPDLLDAGVTALKIEGRMKSPRYTAGVVRIYRKYLDRLLKEGREAYRVEEADRKELQNLFDRGGSCEGYYRSENGKDMIAVKGKPSFRETNPDFFDMLQKTYVDCVRQIPVSGTVRVSEGEPLSLTVSDPSSPENLSVTVRGETVQTAKNSPLTEDQIKRQIQKTGDSLFTFVSLSCEKEGSCFVPVKALNELRREGLKAFEEARLSPFLRKPSSLPQGAPALHISVSEEERKKEGKAESAPPRLHVSVEDAAMLKEVLSFREVFEVYLDSCGVGAGQWKDAVRACHEAGKKCALMLPRIFRARAEEYFKRHARELKDAGFDELILGSLEEPGFLRELGVTLPLVSDSCLYTFNRASSAFLSSLGFARLTLPVELNRHELGDLACEGRELIVYGYLPVMLTAQCVKKTVSGCDRKEGLLFIKDRTGRQFAVRNCCRFCTNIIYNSLPFTLLGEEETAASLAPSVLRLSFTREKPEEIRTVLSCTVRSFLNEEKVSPPFADFTRGHFRRGVD